MDRLALLLFWILSAIPALSQAPLADFSASSIACKNENMAFVNLSSNADRFEWDVCQGDLSLTPTGSTIGTVTGSNIPLGIEVVFDGTTWVGFVTSRNSNSLIRYTFDASFNSISSITDLGNLGGLLNQPVEVKVVSDNGKWYGFISNQSGSVSTSLITRIDFGVNLSSNSPLATSLVSDVTFATDAGLDVVSIGSTWYLLFNQIGLGPSYKTGIIKLNTIESVPQLSEILFISYPGTPSLHDVKVLVQDGTYHAYVVSDGPSKLFHLDFGADIYTTPTAIDISAVLPASISPYGIDGNYDNGNYYLLIATDGGSIVRNNLGSDLSQNPVSMGVNLGNLGVFSSTRKISLIKDKTSWYAFSVNYFTGNIYKASFPSPTCSHPIGFFTSESLQLNFISEGSKAISLRSYRGGEYAEKHRLISVSSSTSPSITIVSDGICLTSSVNFSFQSDQGITSTTWAFGDSNSSPLANPIHPYSTSGEYSVQLTVQATNGCNNFTEKTIKIYDPPSSVFTSPSGLICTNNEFTFANSTIDNFDGNLTYQWLVNDQPVSTLRDLQYSFTGIGDQSVKLISSIPGCASEATQVISNVQSGPTVGFNVTGVCEEETITFTNTSSGNISSFLWNFGNAQTSTNTSPTQVYSAEGTYPVSLQSVGTNGCISSTSKNVVIYSKPLTNFSIDLPPFSCAGTPSQFNDLTPTMTDSNVASWLWNFGDSNNTTATSKNPTHTYPAAGNYNVSLAVTSNFGCSASVQKSISILPSPVASFSNGLACLNQNVQFVNTSGSGLKASAWNIQNTVFNTTNPPLQRFVSAGDYPVQLTVTAANDCRSTVSKIIQIKLPPQLGFSVDKPCTRNETLFQNTSAGGGDPLASLIWDFPSAQQLGSPTGFEFTQSGIYAVKMSYVGQSGCTYAISKNITITEGPIARFQVSDDVGAAPLAVVFTNQSTPSNLSWQWTFKKAATILTESFVRNPNFTFSEVGDYSAELFVTNDLNCSSSFSQPISVVVPRLQVALTDFKLINLTDGSKQAVVTLQNNSNVPVVDPEIALDISGGPSIKEKVIGKIKPGAQLEKTFSVSILPRSLDFACAEWLVVDDEKFDNRKCISLATEPIIFSPFPNPASSHLYFEWISNTTDAARIWIYNSSGQTVFRQELDAIIVGLNRVDINTLDSNLGDGLFYFTFEQAGVKKTFRFLVAKE